MRMEPTGIGDDSDESFDFQSTKELASLVLRAPMRHPKLAAVAFLLVTVLGIVAATFVTPMYEAEAIIRVQRNVAMPALGESQRNTNNDVDPAAGVSEAVKGRENLISLVRQTHLSDKVKEPTHGPSMSEDDKEQ